MELAPGMGKNRTSSEGFLTPFAAAVQLPHMRSLLSRLELTLLLRNVVVFILYFGAARYFLGLTAVNTFAAIVWPPSGIALAAVFLWGYRVTPAIAAAAFAANFSMGAPFVPALAISLGNTLESVVATYILRQYIGLDPTLSRIRDVFGIILCAATASLISASIGVGILTSTGSLPADLFFSTYLAWWAGDTVAMLVITPFLLRWLARPLFRRSFRQLLEGAGIFSFLIAIDFITFYGPLGSRPGSSPLIFATLLPLIWASLRAGPRGATLAIIVTSIISTSATIQGYGPFTRDAVPIAQSLEILQIFNAMLAITFLLFVAAVEERKDALRRTGEYVEKLEQAVHRASSSDQAKNDFLAILGHELRNPLAPMVSALELLKLEETAAPRKGELVDVLDKQMRNMVRLLDDLLDMSRITKRKFKIQKEIVPLQKVLAQVGQSASPFIRERSHTFLTDIPDSYIYVDIDPLRIEQAVVNLLNNAAKYTEPGGSITLRMRSEGNHALIEVSDTGMGIAAASKEKIFEPFVQGSSLEGRSPSLGTGLGIGLSLTKRLVELHRGTIGVESEGPGRGSTFRITLPLVPKESWPEESSQGSLALAEQKAHMEGNKKAPRNKKVLIVDDNVDAAKGLSLLLGHNGRTVAVAYNAQSAFTLMETFGPDAVVLDIGLPDMDGYEVARRIRGQYGDKYTLIALTGYGLEEDKLRARVAGFDHHLTKPVGVVELERALS